MEDIKTTKFNNVAADLPEVKRLPDGSIDIEAITISIDEKNNRIIPDDLFEAYYRELPEKVINESRSWRTARTGKLKIFGADPEEDKIIQDKGRESNASAWAQRKSLRETADYLLTLKGNRDCIEELGLPEGVDAQTVIIWRAISDLQKRSDPNMYKAIEATLGEQPTAKINAEVLNVTPEDQELMKRVAARLEKN